MLDTAQSLAFIIFGLILVVILLKVLAMVHAQAKKVKELETRMDAVEEMEAIEE